MSDLRAAVEALADRCREASEATDVLGRQVVSVEYVETYLRDVLDAHPEPPRIRVDLDDDGPNSPVRCHVWRDGVRVFSGQDFTASLVVRPEPAHAQSERECGTAGCPGDGRYAAPGRGHVEGCTAPIFEQPDPTLRDLLRAETARADAAEADARHWRTTALWYGAPDKAVRP